MLDADLAAHSNDSYFKSVFSVPEYAVAFFQSHLPAETAAIIDWSSLALLPGSFVKGTLQQAHSDLVFSVNAVQRELKLYLLFEHQTTVDPAMPLRLAEFFEWLAKEFASQISDSLLRTSLEYAFNVDSSLDLEEISRRMVDNRTLRNQTMSIAQKLIAQGREEGYERGVLKTCVRQARKKWGTLSDDTLSAIESLNYPQLEQLSEDLLDMASEADLLVWIKRAKA